MNVAGATTDYITLADNDVKFGTWNTTTKSFSATGWPANAVQVTTRRSLPLFFGELDHGCLLGVIITGTELPGMETAET